MDEVVGWLSSAILVATISVQLIKQWRSGTSRGVSKWLFIGQILASLGFVYYSVQTRNWVFVVTNSLLAIEAMLGLGMVIAHRGLRASHADPRPAGRVERVIGSS
jgi:MtN3 and saliva related transmembrane protein